MQYSLQTCKANHLHQLLKLFRSVARLAAVILFLAPGYFGQIDITRAHFTPTVVPETQTDPVLFEATVTGNPASVAFNISGNLRPMFDDGTNGDLTAGDGTWSITFTPQEILVRNVPSRVFRPILGSCNVAGFGSLNVIAEVWTSAIGLRPIRTIDSTGQETDYIANYSATRNELMNFDFRLWAQRFYASHGDEYDFLNFVLVTGRRGNRFHMLVKNTVNGIGLQLFDNSSQYGSAGRLKGFNNFPIPSFFDGGEKAFSHEVGHQWINFLGGTVYAPGVPHWPRGSIAGNVMGFSQGGQGGQGGTFPFTFSANGAGGYLVGSADAFILSTFNSMELYLMGLIPAEEVTPFFVLNNQNLSVTPGLTLQPQDYTTVSVNEIIASAGPRIPAAADAQRDFRVATIVISEQLLDPYAMAFYDYFARRAEAITPLPFSSGLSSGTGNPWYLATGGRSTMTSAITTPTVNVSGRVTTPSGAGLRNAVVSIEDSNGLAKKTTTSTLGFYSFDGIIAGPAYTVRVNSRRYRFEARSLTITGDLTNFDFVGLE